MKWHEMKKGRKQGRKEKQGKGREGKGRKGKERKGKGRKEGEEGGKDDECQPAEF